jgi:tripartite ATP-independent transporter DctM subunit
LSPLSVNPERAAGADPDPFPAPRGGLAKTGGAAATVALGAMLLIPLVEILSRRFGRSLIPGASGYEEHLTLWVAFLGGALAAAYGRHLFLSTATFFRPGRLQIAAQVLSTAAAIVVSLALLQGSWGHVINERTFTSTLGGGIPRWIASLIMPAGYLVVILAFWWRSPGGWKGRAAVLAVVAAAVVLWLLGVREERLLVPGVAALFVAALLGAPLFALLGGLAALLFHADGQPMAAIAIETYGLATMPLLPTLPLFALAGTVLAAGGSSERLVGFFRGLFGWAPAGTAVAAVAACAFFTAVTGASGVTILALGGLLLPILIQEGYPRRFAIGLLTASGSIGLLFPPSLPVILYGIRSEQPIEHLFLAGVFPGILIVGGVAAFSAFSAFRGGRAGVTRTPWDAKATLAAVWRAKWDLFLPVFVLMSLLAGMATLVEAAALTAAYAIFIEVVVHRTLSLRRDTVRVFMETAILMGALLFILGSALGLTGYMVGEEIPTMVTEWVQQSVHSKILFLLTLNVLLLVTGMLLDIFSAIIIVVPLIIPLGAAFGIHPIHLGIIFLCNLELGYLTPPVGLNLFLSSLRFRVPLAEIWRTAVPFLLIFAIWVFLITYVPALTLGLL